MMHYFSAPAQHVVRWSCTAPHPYGNHSAHQGWMIHFPRNPHPVFCLDTCQQMIDAAAPFEYWGGGGGYGSAAFCEGGYTSTGLVQRWESVFLDNA